MLTALFIEDDSEFSSEISDYLLRYKIDVTVQPDITDLRDRISALKPDLLVLDQFVIGQDTSQLIPVIREYYSGGIVIFTGNLSLVDRVVALESGADDFISKQIDPREFLARLRSVHRRVNGDDQKRRLGSNDAEPVKNHGGGRWRLDWLRAEVQAPDGATIRMTGTEFSFLTYAEDRAGKLLTRADITRDVFDRATTGSGRVIDNMVSHIRKLLDPHLNGDQAFRAVRGQGYVFIGLNNVNVEAA